VSAVVALQSNGTSDEVDRQLPPRAGERGWTRAQAKLECVAVMRPKVSTAMTSTLAAIFMVLPTLADSHGMPCKGLQFQVCNSQDYSSGNFKGWDTARVLHPYSARIVAVKALSDLGGQVPDSANVVRFELRHGDRVSDGYRSELKERYNAKYGATIRYSFSLLIPDNYPIEEDHFDKHGYLHGCIFGQWHDEPNPVRKNGREPLFANYYINGDLRIYVKNLMAPRRYDSPNLFYAAYHRANDPLDKGDLVGEVKDFAKGTWHSMQYEVKWLPDSSGYLKAWIDNRLVVDYRGPMGYADEVGSYFKYGVYCKYDVTKPHVVYLGPYLRKVVEQ
jgi:Polysaccharide lyase